MMHFGLVINFKCKIMREAVAVKNTAGDIRRHMGFVLLMLVSFFVSAYTTSAAVSSTTNCQAVSCQSDPSVKGTVINEAGTAVCAAMGMDYAPQCNSAKCFDTATGQGKYACVAQVQTNTTTNSQDGIPNATCTKDGFRCINPSLSCSSTGDPNLKEDATCNSVCGGGFKFCRSVDPSKASTKSTASGAGTSNTPGSDGCEVGFKKISGVCFPLDTQLPDPQGGFMQILDNLLRWLLAIFAILAIGAFVISGIQYLISAGDDDMIETAKRNMKWSAVGVLVGLSGWVILQAISGALSGSVGF